MELNPQQLYPPDLASSSSLQIFDPINHLFAPTEFQLPRSVMLFNVSSLAQFFPFYTDLCRFICSSKNLFQSRQTYIGCISWTFSPLCIFKCVLKGPASEDAQSHWFCICLAFLQCTFSNVSLNCLHEKMHYHIACICLTFLYCVLSNVFTKHLHEQMQNHIGCICVTFLRCAFSNVSSNGLPERMHSHIDCICMTFLHCVFSNVPSN